MEMTIDQRIHKMLYGCLNTSTPHDGTIYARNHCAACGKPYVDHPERVGRYSTDIAAAFEVVDWLTKNGWMVTMSMGPDFPAYVSLRRPHLSLDKHRVDAETLPRAICQAALMVKAEK